MSILIKNGLILTLDENDRILSTGDVLIEGDRILEVGEHIEAQGVERVIDATNRLVMPGLNIAHAHSFAQLFKGVFDGLPLDVWILDTNAPPLGWLASPRQFYLRTVLGAAELIRHGATTVWDDLILTPDNQDTIFNAYKDTGIRAVVTATMYDRRLPDRTLFLRDSLPPKLLEPLLKEKLTTPDEWIKVSEQIIKKWHGQDGRLSFAVSVAWPQGSSDELMLKAADLSRQYNLPFVTHVLETKMQQATGQVFYGKTVVRHLYDLGVLNSRTSIVHGIWTTDEDIQILADNQVTVLHNPGSNLILGSGIMPLRKLREAGVNIALGVDEGIQSKWNPFEMMRTAALLHKISDPDYEHWSTSSEILSMATRGGARSELMQSEIGYLAKGMKADVILLDLDTVYFTPLNNIKNQLVYCEPGHSVVTSIINGEVVMLDKKILTVDVDQLLEEARLMMPDYWKVHEDRNTLEFPRKVRPYVEDIYHRISETPTGLNRWIGDEKEWIKSSK
jgi:5-methylthioadenosine/S-adenosylhomocysteine deaminase